MSYIITTEKKHRAVSRYWEKSCAYSSVWSVRACVLMIADSVIHIVIGRRPTDGLCPLNIVKI